MPEIIGDNLSFYYPDAPPLFYKLSFHLGAEKLHNQPGYVIGLMGPSGCGKSTLLRLLAGLERPRSGRIFPVPETIVISYLSQEAVLLPHYSRLENARYRQFAGRHRDRFDERSFQELSVSLGLSEAFLDDNRPLSPMSGGQKQRLALLRDLSISPDLLLLDEPCVGLDQPVKVELLQQIRRIVAHRSLTVIYVTHHRDEVLLVADELAFLEPSSRDHTSHNLLVGPADDFLRCPRSLCSAKLLGSPLTNSLRCRRISNSLYLADERYGDVELIFGLESVEASPDGANSFPVSVVGSTANIIYARLASTDQVIVVPMPQNPLTVTSVTIAGHALIYGSTPSGPLSVEVETITVQENVCLNTRPA